MLVGRTFLLRLLALAGLIEPIDLHPPPETLQSTFYFSFLTEFSSRKNLAVILNLLEALLASSFSVVDLFSWKRFAKAPPLSVVKKHFSWGTVSECLCLLTPRA